MWSTLALFTTLAGPVPPFLLEALAFSVPALATFAAWLGRGERLFDKLRLPWRVWALGVGGLFGYHALYFLAMQNAPPVEASLIAYLSPLMIVLCSALLPGERLRWWHAVGAVIALAGAFLVVSDGGRVAFHAANAFGYGIAFACAVVWSAYSVLSRLFGEVPSDRVGVFCAATAILAAFCHVLFETTAWPQGWSWAAVLALGIGPVGAAFFTWDHGCKHGDIRALGALFYAAPLASTVLLVLFGRAEASWTVAAAAVLIVAGAALASRDLLVSRPGAAPAVG
ncbi:MAG: EamA family transporter [Alphaproteobacteria bacterium]|nr:EamA family transporter [Alphaproteobacteria bacterium]